MAVTVTVAVLVFLLIFILQNPASTAVRYLGAVGVVSVGVAQILQLRRARVPW